MPKQSTQTLAGETRMNHQSKSLLLLVNVPTQSQALGTTFEARVRDYMEAHTERMERFENVIFKQRRIAEMFRIFKELTTSRAPEKVLIREEVKSPVTKNINSISLTRGEEKRNDDNDIVIDDDIKKTIKTEMKVAV
nr:hypothetical protein [Tanacetum cinerariifolium]